MRVQPFVVPSGRPYRCPIVLPSRENEWQLAQVGRFSITVRLCGSPMFRNSHLMSGRAVGGSGVIGPFCLDGGDHQWNVAVENRRADGILRGRNRHPSGRHWLPCIASANPVIVIVAGDFTDNRLIFAQVSTSGFQVCVVACSGVSSAAGTRVGVALAHLHVLAGRFDADSDLNGSAKETSTTQRFAVSLESRQRKVGGVISGGKMEPSAG